MDDDSNMPLLLNKNRTNSNELMPLIGKAKLPSQIQRNQLSSHQSSLREESTITKSVPVSNNLEKHLKEVNKQKELLLKLQREKEELEK